MALKCGICYANRNKAGLLVSMNVNERFYSDIVIESR